MTREVREQKLNSIARCIERLREKKPKSLSELQSQVDLQDIVMLNLERLVQLSVDLANILISEKNLNPMPDSMAATFDVLYVHKIIDKKLKDRMKKSVGFRNLAVHEYDKINWKIVYRILTEHISDFQKYASIMDTIK